MNILKSIKNRSMEVIHELFLLPKIIYFNFRVLPIEQAIRFPIYVNYGVKIKEVHQGIISIKSDKISKYMISFGRGGSEGIAKSSSGLICLRNASQIIFEGTAQFHAGIRLWVDENGIVTFGNNFSANRNFTLYYNDEICFGHDCMLGWNVEIIDGNGHRVIVNGVRKNSVCKINIGNHVWIGANVKIGRSVDIGDNCIVAYGSTVVGGVFLEGTMLGGYPAKVIKDKINWEK